MMARKKEEDVGLTKIILKDKYGNLSSVLLRLEIIDKLFCIVIDGNELLMVYYKDGNKTLYYPYFIDGSGLIPFDKINEFNAKTSVFGRRWKKTKVDGTET